MDFIFDDDVDEVGAEIEAFCPKCKADTTHVVISRYEDEIRRVQCNPCGDVHPYRKPRGDVDEDAPAEPVSAKKRAAKVKPTWEQVMAKPKREPKLYLISTEYKENDLINHPKFGAGFVSDVIAPDKIEVTFQSGRRILVHNKQGMSLPPAAYTHAVDVTLPVKAAKGKGKQVAAAKPAPPPPVEKPAEKKGAKPAAKPVVAEKPAEKKGAKPAAKPVVAEKKPAAAPAKKPAAAPAKPPVAEKKPAAKPQPKAAAKPVAKKPVPAKKPAAAAKPQPAKKPVVKPARPAAKKSDSKAIASARPAKAKPKARAAAPAKAKQASKSAAVKKAKKR